MKLSRIPTGFFDVLTPVLIVVAAFALAGLLHDAGLIPNVLQELAAAIFGTVLCWVLVVTTKQGEEPRG